MALVLILLASVAAIPIVWVLGSSGGDGNGAAAGHAASSEPTWSVAPLAEETSPATASSQRPLTGAPATGAPVAPVLSTTPVTYEENWNGAQATVVDVDTGDITGTATHRFARPALSLVKLYLANYVVDHGALEHRDDALKMVRDSSDRTAAELFREYPGAIDHVAEEFGLSSTRAGEEWGQSRTSTYDVAVFVAALLAEDPRHPVLVAMASADPVAADGYAQDFGTAVLPGELGTKWAWSDAHDLHASVSFGDGWVAAAAVTGDAEDLTEFVEAQLGEAVS